VNPATQNTINLVDQTCELIKWLCNYRMLHKTTTREQFRQYSILCRRNTHQKLVPETCTCIGQSGTSFWYGMEHSSIPLQKLCGTWHEPCNVIGRWVVLVQETVVNLRQIFCASILLPVSGACVAGITPVQMITQMWPSGVWGLFTWQWLFRY